MSGTDERLDELADIAPRLATRKPNGRRRVSWDGDLSNPEPLALRVALEIRRHARWMSRRELVRGAFGDKQRADIAASTGLQWLNRRGYVVRAGKAWNLNEAGRAWLDSLRGAR